VQEGVKLLREAIEIGTQELGERHPQIAAMMNALANKLGPENHEAIELHRKALEIQEEVLGPDHPATRLSRANVEWDIAENWRRTGEFSKAIESYSTAIRFKPDMRNHPVYAKRGIAYCAIGNWQKAISDFDRGVDLNPNSLSWICDLRGRAFAALGQWEKAADDFTTALEIDPNRLQAWLQLMPVLVMAGDVENYRLHCFKGLELARGSDDTQTAEVACKLCLLLPGVVDVNELAIQRISNALQDGNISEHLKPWYWGCRAIFAFRSGSFRSALEFADKSLSFEPNDHLKALNLAVMAMAEYALSERGKSVRSLESAKELMDRICSQPESQGHHDVLIAMIFYREAESQILGRENP